MDRDYDSNIIVFASEVHKCLQDSCHAESIYPFKMIIQYTHSPSQYPNRSSLGSLNLSTLMKHTNLDL
jgi:hypothetical protein